MSDVGPSTSVGAEPATLPEGLPDLTAAMVTCDDDPSLLSEVLAAALGERLSEPLLVVDMSRGDDVRKQCARHGSAIRYIAAPDSSGISDSRNRAVANVETRFVLFVDADAMPRPGWARAIRGGFDGADGTAIVGARCVARWTDRPPPLFQTAPAGDFMSLLDLGDTPLDVPRIVGTSFAIDLTRIPEQPFDPGLGIGRESRLGGEEIDLCARVREAGWLVRYEPSALVEHSIRPSRATWRSMMRRAFNAGREGRRLGRRLDPLPRQLTLGDRAFQAAIAPAFVAGMLRETVSSS